ncbi:helix-turn-helix domain-containing protein [Novosphingobium sp. ZN18A2]|uniref:helix-turn-helix domain-containing protein n=1 Tax=Novosphingobium sp. ZN18A2 TaxID=3079861 RepID=UPI0030D452AB
MAEADVYTEDTQENAPPGGVGARLRAAREEAGKSISDLSDETRIAVRHLENIEAGDFAALPGRPYAIGFSRSVARALGLDDAEIADSVREELDALGPSDSARTVQQFEVGDPAKTPGTATVWIAVAVALAVLVAGGLFWSNYYSPATGLPPLAGAPEPAPAANRAATPTPSTSPAPTVNNGPVVFTALADKIWIKFYDGSGKQLMQKQMAQGESYTVPVDAKDPQVWTGRPDAFAITVGGKPVPPLADAQTVVKDVPVTPSALLARGNAASPAPQASSTTTM